MANATTPTQTPTQTPAEPPETDPTQVKIYYGVHSTEIRSDEASLWMGGDVGWLTIPRWPARDADAAKKCLVRWQPFGSAEAFPARWQACLHDLVQVRYTLGGEHRWGRSYPGQLVLCTKTQQVRLGFQNAEPVSGLPAIEEALAQLRHLCAELRHGVKFSGDESWFANGMDLRHWRTTRVAAFQAERRAQLARGGQRRPTLAREACATLERPAAGGASASPLAPEAPAPEALEALEAPAPEAPKAPEAPAPGDLLTQAEVDRRYAQHPLEVRAVIRKHGIGQAGNCDRDFCPPARGSGAGNCNRAAPAGYLLPSMHPYLEAEIASARAAFVELCAAKKLTGDCALDGNRQGLAHLYWQLILEMTRAYRSELDDARAGLGVSWWIGNIEKELEFREVDLEPRRWTRRGSDDHMRVMVELAIKHRLNIFAGLRPNSRNETVAAVEAEVHRRMRGKQRKSAAQTLAHQLKWDRKWAAQQAVYDHWQAFKATEAAQRRIAVATDRFREQTVRVAVLQGCVEWEGPCWAPPPLERAGHQALLDGQAGAQLSGTRADWKACIGLAEDALRASDSRRDRTREHLKQMEAAKGGLQEESARLKRDTVGLRTALQTATASRAADEHPQRHEQGGDHLELVEAGRPLHPTTRAAAERVWEQAKDRFVLLKALWDKLPERIGLVAGLVERERQYSTTVQSILFCARGALYNLENEDDDSVVVGQERTLAERNEEGFASAIVLSSDDEDDERQPAKKLKAEHAVVDL